MTENTSWAHHFVPYSATHACVVIIFAALMSVMIAVRCRDDICLVEPRRKFLDNLLGGLGLAAAIFVQTVTLWPGWFYYRTSLPLHICDIVMFVAPLALLLKWKPLRAIAYFWGLGLSSLSFIIPDLKFGPADFQFWVFWAGHATIVGSALYDVTGRRFRPSWRDWWTAVGFCFLYAIIIFPVDAVFHLNYGYIGETYNHQRSPADLLGPWPWRVPLMFLFACAIMTVLLLPWLILRRVRAGHMQSGLPAAGTAVPELNR